jgi:hypothetical protein
LWLAWSTARAWPLLFCLHPIHPCGESPDVWLFGQMQWSGLPPDDFLHQVIYFANQVALPFFEIQNLVLFAIYAGINIKQGLEKKKI